MPVRSSEAVWQGNLKEGSGTMKLGSGGYEGPYTYASRFEEGRGTNPEELVGAAHAGCFSMFLSAQLSKAGFEVRRIQTTAKVHLAEGAIQEINLVTQAEVSGVDEATFQNLVLQSKENCPISKALAAVPTVTVAAKLVG